MSLAQLSRQLRQVRSRMPRVTSEEAYAQMAKLMGRTNSSAPKKNGKACASGQPTKV